MQFRLHLGTVEWEARYTQSGNDSGWSEWMPLNRLDALRFIEYGWSFDIIDQPHHKEST